MDKIILGPIILTLQPNAGSNVEVIGVVGISIICILLIGGIISIFIENKNNG